MRSSMFLNRVVGLGSSLGNENLEVSIQAHITLLLNTRRGSLPHRPEYGLPDIQSIYQNQRGSTDLLEQAITEALTQFEPRIRNVLVKRSKGKEDNACATFRISGQVGVGSRISRLSFETEVLRDGRYHTKLVKQYG